ncbi:MAG: exopolyphosphatase [Desulfuromonas sp.]|uniref:Ppx/GppA phosphatase family protein n=1 Tax=Desulfuromonas sp. TaxID=892 RepID=UPI000CA9C544|nr:hypothetical protein [Desulfuromonas sp.]PLX86129.1 MAG: exopolyphosphatase [Desulfuromonas sp.]
MLAAIDVGTNTVRLLLGRVTSDGLVPVEHHRVITRLGGGYSPEGNLSREALDRTLQALAAFAGRANRAGVRWTRAVGTEALRQAPNGPAFCRRVKAETGLSLEIVDGAEEARLCARGILAGLSPKPVRCILFDVGGGSTEIMLRSGGELAYRRSYHVGAVQLTESFPGDSEQRIHIAAVLRRIGADLERAGWGAGALDGFALVGTAGTVTTLAALDLGLAEYDWRRVNNHFLITSGIRDTLGLLEGLPPEGREALAGMERGRGDLIVPGTRLVLGLMELFGRERLTVSDFGLLEGILLTGPGKEASFPGRSD